MKRLLADRYIFRFKEIVPSRVIFMFSLRSAKNMCNDNNFKAFIKSIAPSPKKLIRPTQVHGSKVILIERENSHFIFKCDSLITKERRIALTVFTADCLSVFLYDSKNIAIGIIHTGWRGTKERIVSKTIKSMYNFFGTKPADLYVAFGPAIRKCCYEVGREFKNFFPRRYIYERKDRLYFDLVRINKDELVDCGVDNSHILDCLFCTSCNNDILFSYRKESKTNKRMISLAMLC
ncbi:MAG: peptidoglycan editing factor PgeF [Candidatus Omnitrophica bacterium]|nr:peptidoglycan editing factor PgeF [Candidatus Omnitrophota bacterium]